MIRHIVMWKFSESAEGKTKVQNISHAKEILAALPAMIPQIKKFETSENITSSEFAADLMLWSEFDSVEDMKTYNIHPEHKKVSVFIRSVIFERVVHDSEI